MPAASHTGPFRRADRTEFSDASRARGQSAPQAQTSRRPMVTPFARALDLLGVFTAKERWLGNRDLAARTGLPGSTVTRIAQSLVLLGYLHYGPTERKYRLAAPVLALGYAAIMNSEVQRAALLHMQAFASQHKVLVNLSARERLDLIVLTSCNGLQTPLPPNLDVGTRVGIGSSPMGWALLAALPEMERYYLMESVERRMPHEWRKLRRRSGEAIAQVYEKGFCASLGDWDRALGIIAVPLSIEGHAPLVLTCVDASARMARPRVERELGPRLIAMATAIQQAGIDE